MIIYYCCSTKNVDICYILNNQKFKPMKSVMREKMMFLFLLTGFCAVAFGQAAGYVEFKGKIIDRQTNAPLTYCNVMVSEMNVATVTNTEGEFTLKLPAGNEDKKLIIRYIGYKSRSVGLKELLARNGVIVMDMVAVQLPQIDVLTQDAAFLVKTMFDKVPENYPQHDMFMTAFYRESIRKSKTYVSLSEAVVDIQKPSYSSFKYDAAKIFKSRKQTDYSRLDTLVFKLMGGPYNNLLMDVIKHPDVLFADDMYKKYFFTFDKVEWMDDRLIYVVNFNPYPQKEEALYSGKLYIDASTMALKSVVFNLNLENQDKATEMFIKKKPLNARVTPIEANYRMDYVEKNGKWYYAYSRIELGMKINWKRKLFNSNYYSTVEMAITDRENSSENKAIKFAERLKSTVIISETADGFADPDFWGPLNVIEPEKPIEAAIKKIQKHLEK